MNKEEEIDTNTPQVSDILDWRYFVRSSTANARAKIKYEQAAKYKILPISIFEMGNEKLITLLSNERLSHDYCSELQFITGCRVNLEYVQCAEFSSAIYAAYHTAEQSLINALSNSIKVVAPRNNDLPKIHDAAIPILLRRILDKANLLSATDVHIEPHKDSYRVRFRICGELVEDSVLKLDKSVAKNLIRCIKVKSKIENIYGPCDGKFKSDGFNAISEIRVSILPLAEDEKVALRLFSNKCLGNFENLGLTNIQAHYLESALSFDHGAIIVAGPTGSGKSTMLYQCLKSLDLDKLNVVTVEDPIEHKIIGAAQVDLSLSKTLSYKDILPFILRQDPDVLMLGEIRDAQTAQLAFESALTGKLLLTTLHAGNSLEALLRLNKLSVCSQTLASTLRLVVSGRLLARNCSNCISPIAIPKRFKDYFAINKDFYLQSKGCKSCIEMGTAGRVGAYEFLPVSSSIKSAINQNFSIEKIGELARADGFRPFSVQIIDYLEQGVVSLETACKALGISKKLI